MGNLNVKGLPNKVEAIILPWNGFLVDTDLFCLKAHVAALEAIGSIRADNWTLKDTQRLQEMRHTEVFEQAIWEGNSEFACEVYYQKYAEVSRRIKPIPKAVELLKELYKQCQENDTKLALLSRKSKHLLVEEVEKCGLSDYFYVISGSNPEKDEPHFNDLLEKTSKYAGHTSMLGLPKDRGVASELGIIDFLCLSGEVTVEKLHADLLE